MIRAELSCHPLTPTRTVRSIVSVVRHRDHVIDLTFLVSGDISKIALPAREDSRRADELWQHTCFEMFVRSRGAATYAEFNFSPSTRWAAYSFSGYRQGMANKELHRAPTILISATQESLNFDVQLEARDLPASAELALSAVIEESSGGKSYWALKHPSDKPDFHHEHGFVLILN